MGKIIPIETIITPELISLKKFNPRIPVGTKWEFEHFRKGKLIDQWEQGNVNTDEGLNAFLDIMFHNDTQIATWYLCTFETDVTPLVSHTYAVPGYTECTAIDEVTRPAFNEAAASAKVLTNSANKATLTYNATKTIYGAALVGGETAVTGPIASFADYGATVAGTVLATDAAHGCSSTDVVEITDTTNYNGTYVITVVDVDTFYFTATWVASETGNWTNKSSQKKGDVAGGGCLFCASKFGTSKSVASTDVLIVTCTITLADV